MPFFWKKDSSPKQVKSLNRIVSEADESNEIVIGKFKIYKDRRILKFADNETKLSPGALDSLALLARHKNQHVRREDILNTIWGESTYFTGRSMDVYINKLRKYLEMGNRLSLTNIHGEGNILEENV